MTYDLTFIIFQTTRDSQKRISIGSHFFIHLHKSKSDRDKMNDTYKSKSFHSIR